MPGVVEGYVKAQAKIRETVKAEASRIVAGRVVLPEKAPDIQPVQLFDRKSEELLEKARHGASGRTEMMRYLEEQLQERVNRENIREGKEPGATLQSYERERQAVQDIALSASRAIERGQMVHASGTREAITGMREGLHIWSRRHNRALESMFLERLWKVQPSERSWKEMHPQIHARWRIRSEGRGRSQDQGMGNHV